MAIRKLNKKDYAVGQEVALRFDGNRARNNRNGYILGEITKLGNKLIHVGDIKIDMETGYEKSNYSANYMLYDSEQDLLNEIEKEKLLMHIRTKLGNYGACEVSYDKIKKIAEILEIE